MLVTMGITIAVFAPPWMFYGGLILVALLVVNGGKRHVGEGWKLPSVTKLIEDVFVDRPRNRSDDR